MKLRTMSIPEAAEHLGISRTRMKKLVDTGTIPAVAGSGKGNRRTVSYSMVISYASQRGKRHAQQPAPSAIDMSTWPRQMEGPNAKPRLIEQMMKDAAGIPMDTGRATLLDVDGPTAEDLELDEHLYCLANNTEYRPRIIVGLRPTREDTVIFTDNPGVVEWLARQGIDGCVVTRQEIRPHEARGKHIIAGIIPVYIQAEARTYSTIRARGVFIGRATADELEQAGAQLITYTPPRPSDNPWERC